MLEKENINLAPLFRLLNQGLKNVSSPHSPIIRFKVVIHIINNAVKQAFREKLWTLVRCMANKRCLKLTLSALGTRKMKVVWKIACQTGIPINVAHNRKPWKL